MTQPDAESEDAALRRRRARAIASVIAAAATFAVAAALVKWIAPAIPTIQIVFFRSVVSLMALSPMIRREGGLKVLATRRLGWHMLRTLAGFGGMFTAFYGYARLPLAEVTALGFTMPLFLTALSIPLLGERVGIRRWSAVIIGFLGVLLILRPGAGELALGPALVVVLGAVCWAIAMIAIRRMGELGESNVVIVAWFSIGGTVLAGALTLFAWVTPTAQQFAILVGVGLVSTLAQLLMTEAYRRGEASIVAPFEYTGILWTGLIGLVIWDERPAPTMLAGVAILVASGLYILHREVVRRRSR
ncbi:DMT family transporter [Elioraea sp.]|uniref:DMT family transporter n=1 Tax=Elioraea sp. TaxID=2185103 RepID=UPI0021DB9B43|nr:DMT family transporter [Elioraea sp.]GIX09743.1 MAG: DMT transporter permease [Elioraea sp.]